MIISMYENNLPMRFGVILYSTTFIKMVEMSGGELQVSKAEDGQVEEDISNLVFASFNSFVCFLIFYLFLVFAFCFTFVIFS